MLAESRNYLAVAFLKLCSIVTKCLFCLEQKRDGVCIKRTCNKVGGGSTLVAVLTVVHCQPVAVVVAAKPKEFLGTCVVQIHDPLAHHGVMLGKQLFVTVGEVDLPRDDAGGICPAGSNGYVFTAVLFASWNELRNATV